MADRAVLTIEEAIAQADAIPPLPADDTLPRLPLVQRLEVIRQQSDRQDLRRAVIAGGLSSTVPPLFVEDRRCTQPFTVLGYIAHTEQVQHQPGDVTPAPRDVDERDRGRGGESKTAVLS